MDEKELLKTQIKSYEFYAGLIERAVGGGASARLPRWDEQRAIEYRELAEQLRQRLAELESQENTSGDSNAGRVANTSGNSSETELNGGVTALGDTATAVTRQ